MRLLRLGARGYRNLLEFSIEPHPRFNVLEGNNAQGKTNLLELIYVLGALKSFRTGQNKELVQFGADQAEVVCTLERSDAESELRVVLTGGRRRAFLDGMPARRVQDVLGTMQVVLFAPEDVMLLRGTPGDRRAFLDRAVFNSHAAYLSVLSRYGEILRQRNAVLRAEHADQRLLNVYDEQLAESGAYLVNARLLYVEAYRPYFLRAFADIFGEPHDVGLDYEVSWLPAGVVPTSEDMQQALADALQASRQRDLRRGHTSAGPHRDDLLVTLDGRLARVHASQGQHRALVLALKISEITMLKERFSSEPILLLDDVSSELDEERNRQLFAFLSQFEGQVFITTTSRGHIRLEHARTTWQVEDGGLTQL